MYEIFAHSLGTDANGNPAFGPPLPAVAAIANAIQQRLDNNPGSYPPPFGRVRVKQAGYGGHLRSAFAAERSSGSISAAYSLAPDDIPSRANDDGGWDPIDGVSVQVFISPTPQGASPHYLSIGQEKAPGVECTFDVANDTGADVIGVTLFLSHTRSRLLFASLIGPGLGRLADWPNGHGTMRYSQFPHPVAPGGKVTVRWTFTGDPPHVRAVTWWLSSGSQQIKSDDVSAPPRAVPIDMVPTLAGSARSRADELAMRARFGMGGPHESYRKFFRALDEATQPSDAGGRAYEYFASYLRARYLVRGEDAGFGDVPIFDSRESEYWRRSANHVATLMKRLMGEHFRVGDDAALIEHADAAFMLFAGGLLTDFDTHGAPNGVQFFAFAEFALLCVELSIDARFWQQMAQVFARASEVFARCYHLCCGPRTTCSYAVRFNPGGERGFDAMMLAELEIVWRTVDTLEGLGSIVHAALYDELFRGSVSPFDLVDHCPGQSPCPTTGRKRRSRDFPNARPANPVA
jgi:hypothetical protein